VADGSWLPREIPSSRNVERNWRTIGPQLVGKIHVAVGDMDNYFLNLGWVSDRQHDLPRAFVERPSSADALDTW